MSIVASFPECNPIPLKLTFLAKVFGILRTYQPFILESCLEFKTTNVSKKTGFSQKLRQKT